MNQPLFFHPRVSFGKGKRKKIRRATVAAIVRPSPDGNTLFMYMGISVCSEKDQFVKAHGRNKAGGIASSSKPHSVREFNAPLERTTEAFVKASIEYLNELGYEVLPKEKNNPIYHTEAAIESGPLILW